MAARPAEGIKRSAQGKRDKKQCTNRKKGLRGDLFKVEKREKGGLKQFFCPVRAVKILLAANCPKDIENKKGLVDNRQRFPVQAAPLFQD